MTARRAPDSDAEMPLFDAADHPELGLVFADADPSSGPVYEGVELLTEVPGGSLYVYQEGARRTEVPRGGRMWLPTEELLEGRERV